jgi:hypothetical protein
MNRRRWLGLALGGLSVGCARPTPPPKLPALFGRLEGRIGRPHTRTVTLEWQKPTDKAVVGFRLYTGRASRDYDFAVDLGLVTTTTCVISRKGEWFFALTTLTENWESEFSPESRYTV